MPSIPIVIGLVLSLVWTSHLGAEDNTCWLSAPPQDDVWVIVYDTDDDGTRGSVIWRGKIPAGGKIKVSSSYGNIHYNYTLDPDQTYAGDVPAGCYQQRDIRMD